MVSVTTVLQSGLPGPAPSCAGSPGEGWTEGPGSWGSWARGQQGMGCGVQKCLHSWGSPTRLVPRTVPCPDSQVWAEDGGVCPGMDPPRAQGKVGSWGSPQGSSVPSAHQREPGVTGGDQSVKHNRSPSGTKEGRSRGPPGPGPPGAQAWGFCGHGHRDGTEGGPLSPCRLAALRG